MKDSFFIFIFVYKNISFMEIINKNTFTDEKVHFDRERGLIYIGKSCFSIEDIERVVTAFKSKDLNESLNYRVRKYANS